MTDYANDWERGVHEQPPIPFDPYCRRFAADMRELDTFIEREEGFEVNRSCTIKEREEYVRENEGTYNKENGHFACDECYIKIGSPSGPSGWTAP